MGPNQASGYTTRLLKGGAVLDDTRRVVRLAIGVDDVRGWLHGLADSGETPPWSDGVRARLSQGLLAPTRETATKQLIAGGESKLVEFKQTAGVNVHTHKRDPVLELTVVKTVAGLMNAEGGTLLVGVTDTGEVSGIDADLKTFGRRQTTDGFALWLNNLLDNALGPTAASLVRISFESHDDKTLSRVDVTPGKQPAFVRSGKGEADLYVRLNNATRRLNTSEALNFIRTKWN
ncbi:MAG: ATP-binding protein [Acidimicrobiaceae bacterium]|nr:ATP-binding protein [Acidimicrobiaceae bacterium]